MYGNPYITVEWETASSEGGMGSMWSSVDSFDDDEFDSDTDEEYEVRGVCFFVLCVCGVLGDMHIVGSPAEMLLQSMLQTRIVLRHQLCLFLSLNPMQFDYERWATADHNYASSFTSSWQVHTHLLCVFNPSLCA